MAAFGGKNWGVTLNWDLIVVDSLDPRERDPDWRYTDAAGHIHEYNTDGGVSSVVWVVTDRYWCEDCLDEHTEGEYRCKECGEVVQPGTRRAPSPQYLAGPTHVEGYVDSTHPNFERLVNATGPVDLSFGDLLVDGAQYTAIEERFEWAHAKFSARSIRTTPNP